MLCKGNAPAGVKDGEFYIHQQRAPHHIPYPFEVRRKVPGGFEPHDAYKTEQHARMAAAALSIAVR